jgi:GT2 family glycosyltransferase
VQPNVAIVILNWNGWPDTVLCLASLQKLEYSNCHALVVDNGSTDDSAARIREQYPEVEVIELGRNVGFAAGCNAGIARAMRQHADHIWLLNNDTTVDFNALRSLVDKAESSPEIGAVGSAIYFADQPDRLQAWGGGKITFWLGRSRHFLKPVPDDRIDFITGASLLLSATASEELGPLDENFFMYWEDADYCFRLRRAGWKLAVAGDSKVWHKGSASVGPKSARMDAYFNASAARFFHAHAPVPAFTLWTGVALRILKRIFAGDWDRARAVWQSVRGA